MDSIIRMRAKEMVVTPPTIPDFSATFPMIIGIRMEPIVAIAMQVPVARVEEQYSDGMKEYVVG